MGVLPLHKWKVPANWEFLWMILHEYWWSNGCLICQATNAGYFFLSRIIHCSTENDVAFWGMVSARASLVVIHLFYPDLSIHNFRKINKNQLTVIKDKKIQISEKCRKPHFMSIILKRIHFEHFNESEISPFIFK